jgi:thiamine phosphate synthase YjbQ (UPF0047 family)
VCSNCLRTSVKSSGLPLVLYHHTTTSLTCIGSGDDVETKDSEKARYQWFELFARNDHAQTLVESVLIWPQCL